MPVEIKPERSLSREGETSLGLPWLLAQANRWRREVEFA